LNTRILASLLLALGAVSAAHAADIKPGLWEFKTKMDMPGMPDMAAQMAQMQEQMKNMPPEARKMMEQQMAAHGVGMGNGGAVRICITPEDARRSNVYSGKTDADCTYSNVSNTATRVKGHISCTSPKADGDFEATIDSPTHFTSRMNMRSAEGNMKADTDARWVAADCGKIKPAPR
jgi:hypothetical protein